MVFLLIISLGSAKPPEYHMDNDTMMQQASQREVFEKNSVLLVFRGRKQGFR